MRWPIALAFVVLVVGNQAAAGDDKRPPGKQLQINLRVLEGDPLGSREARTLKVLAEPRLLVLENRPFTFHSGGQVAVSGSEGLEFVDFGQRIEAKPGAVKDGKVPLDITLSHTTVGDRTDQSIRVNTESTRTITTVRLGEVLKLRFRKGTPDRQTWIELSMEEVKP